MFAHHIAIIDSKFFAFVVVLVTDRQIYDRIIIQSTVSSRHEVSE